MGLSNKIMGINLLPNKKFSIIYADPPWQYARLQFNNKVYALGYKKFVGAKDFYPTMTADQLKSLPVQSIAKNDCLLFMWATSPLLNEAIELGEAWGFKYVTVAFIWDKQRKLAGNYTMSQCEMCLVFKRGKIPAPRGARNIGQFLSVRKYKHSAKPIEVANRIFQMFPNQSRIELFARSTAPDWEVWGNEVNSKEHIPKQKNLVC